MKLEEKAILAAKDEKLKNELIGEYQNFILSCVSKVLKRSVTISDDEFITGMMAFNEAVDSYDETKGRFTSFASMIIRNRVIDLLRREAKHNAIPFSSLASEDDNGELIEYEIHSNDSVNIKWEIDSLTKELEKFDISFFDLAEVTPKSRKTKRLCFDAIRYIIQNDELVNIVMKKHILPIKEVTDNIKSNRKTLERHRKYIITAIVVVTQDYPAIAGYFNVKEV